MLKTLERYVTVPRTHLRGTGIIESRLRQSQIHSTAQLPARYIVNIPLSMEIDASLRLADEALETALNSIHTQALLVVDAHWSAVSAHEKNATEWKDKSVLQLSCHRKGNHIQMKWIVVSWVGRAANRRQIKTNIPKSANEFKYTMASLLKHARQWEGPLIAETESKLASLRKQASFVVKAKVSLRYATMEAGKFEESSTSPDEVEFD